MSIDIKSALAKKLNVRTVFSSGIAVLVTLLVSAAQLEEYTKAYAMLALCIILFIMYLVTCIPAVAQWIVDLTPQPLPVGG